KLALGSARRVCAVGGFVVTLSDDGRAPVTLYREQWSAKEVAESRRFEVIFLEEGFDAAIRDIEVLALVDCMQPLPLSGGGVRRPAEPETPDAPPARRSRTVSESVPRSTPQLLADAERALLGRSPIAGDVSDAERTAPATTPATPDSQPTPPTEPSFALTTPEMSFDEQHAQQADTPQRDFVEEEEEPWWETPAERDPRKSDTPRRAHVADTAPAAPAQEVPAVAEPNVQGAVNSDSNREGSSAVDGDAESVDDAASVACSEGSAAVSDADDLVESEAKSDGIETQSNEDETEDQREDDDTEGQSVGDETEEHRAEGEELSDEDEEESDAGSDGSSAADDSGVAEVEKETEDSEDDAESDEDDNDARMNGKTPLYNSTLTLSLSTIQKCELQRMLELDYESSKIKAVMELLVPLVEGGEKCVVVSEWISLLKIVARHLDAAGISHETMSGKTEAKERHVSGMYAVTQRFNNAESEPRVLLLASYSSGTGVDLPGGTHMFVMEPHKSAALQEQVFNRLHRIGQTKDVHCHMMVTVDTIEEDVVRERKSRARENRRHLQV
ncbi:Protein F54E12.2, partial [Aphelenchoides avenae]